MARSQGSPPARQSPGQLGQTASWRVQQEHYQGVLPPPTILAQYRELLPDAPQRLFAMVEQQAVHRHYLERTALEADIKRSNMGLWSGFTIAIVGLLAAVGLAMTGHSIVGGLIGTVDLVSLAGIFVYGSLLRRNERMKRLQSMTGQAPTTA
jgi:uncharacterized membrane protein